MRAMEFKDYYATLGVERSATQDDIKLFTDDTRTGLNATLEIGSQITVDRSNIGGNIYGPDADGEWLVYGREGKPCRKCSTPIARIVQGTRSTFFCRNCQRR